MLLPTFLNQHLFLTSAKLTEVQKALSQVKMEIGELTEKALPGLLQELGELQATSILKGDYELKIARQDYFTSKQEQVGFSFLYSSHVCSHEAFNILIIAAYRTREIYGPRKSQYHGNLVSTTELKTSISYRKG